MNRLIGIKRAAVLILALTLVGSTVSAQIGSGSNAYDSDEVGTLADMAMIDGALKVQIEYFGDLPLSGEKWVEIEEIQSSLNGAAASNIPARDRWGNPFLLALDDEGWLTIVSCGPNGIFDDRGIWVDLLKGEEPQKRSNHVRSDDLAYGYGRVIKGPRSIADRLFQAKVDLRTLLVAGAAYSVDNDVYPKAGDLLVDILAVEEMLGTFYLSEVPKIDPWGNPYMVLATGEHFMVMSLGSDGIPDIDYANADLEEPGWGRPESTDSATDIVNLDGVFVSFHSGMFKTDE